MESAEELSRLRALVKALDRTVRQLNANLASTQNQLQNARAELETHRRRVAIQSAATLEWQLQFTALNTALQGSKHKIDDMERSLSWRITAPLRALGRNFVKG